MSGYTEGGVGFNAADASRDAAEMLESTGSARVQEARVLADLRAQGHRGTTMGEAISRLRMKTSAYTGRRAELHRTGQVVRLVQTRDGQHVYVIPGLEGDRPVSPFRANTGRSIGNGITPADVRAAVDSLERWSIISEGEMWPSAPDWEALRIVLGFARNGRA